jgi:hypothetical protein
MGVGLLSGEKPANCIKRIGIAKNFRLLFPGRVATLLIFFARHKYFIVDVPISREKWFAIQWHVLML